jgi:PAS domain S-box-containing protein
MSAPRTSRLLTFARELQRASTFFELLSMTRDEVEQVLGYRHAWMFISETDEITEVKLIDYAGSKRDQVWEQVPVIPAKGDAMIEEIMRSDRPVIVEDARTDPRTNKQIVEMQGNRTIVNVPLRLVDKPFGAFGTGTFGDEGCCAPTPEQVDYLIGMGNQLSVAAGRIRFLEERRRADLALRKSEEDLRITLHSIGDAVIATDAAGLVTRMNPVAEQLTGWPFAEARGRPLSEVFRIVHEDSHTEVESPVDHVLRVGTVMGLANHTALISRDGTTRAIADSGAPIRDEAGELRGVVLVFHDQTRQRAAERAAQRATDRLKVLVETSQQLASTTNVEVLARTIAQRISELIGEVCAIRLISKDGMWLEAPGAVYHPDPEKTAYASEVLETTPWRVGHGLLGKVAATGEALLLPTLSRAEIAAHSPPRYHALAEHLDVASLLAVPLKARGRVVGVMSMARSASREPYNDDDLRLVQDVADRAALAFENAQLLAELEERVVERTAALAEANRELETFSYSVSHDLRAPLRSIEGFSSALLSDFEDELPSKVHDYLGRIHGAAQRMSSLIEDLLRLSRVGQAEFRREWINVSAIAASVVGELQRSQPERKVQVNVQAGVVAVADPRLVRITLENLLGNAWKFTAKTPSPEIEFGATEQAGEFVYYVRDNGAGFDMKYAERLFGAFQRLHSDSEFPGTGIGLATVHRVVQRHRGRIWATAAVNQGATFRFTLPPVQD